MKTLKEEIQRIEIENILPDENQPRKYFDPVKISHLKDSISKYGIMNPITVEKVGNRYLLVDGERRFRAASELKLKDVPAVVIAPQSSVDRLIQQFHIQEQHEGWTAVEKASVVGDLAKEMKLSITDLAKLLGIDDRSTATYKAFDNLLEKKEIIKHEINLQWAVPINNISNLAERLYGEKLKLPFDQTMRRKLEKAILVQIRSGEVLRITHLNKLKDVFVKDPKSIDKFIQDGATVSELFLKTKAQGAFYLRQAATSSSYVRTNIHRFMENPDAVPSKKEIDNFKGAREAIDQLLKKVQD